MSARTPQQTRGESKSAAVRSLPATVRIVLPHSGLPKRRARAAVTRPVFVLLRPSAKTAAVLSMSAAATVVPRSEEQAVSPKLDAKTAAVRSLFAGSRGPARIVVPRSGSPKQRVRTAVTRPVLVLLRPSVKTAAHSLLATATGPVRILVPRSATAVICPAFVLLVSSEQAVSPKLDAKTAAVRSLFAGARGPARIVVPRSGYPKPRVRTAVTHPVLVLLRPSVKTAARYLLATARGPARILVPRSASPKQRARTAVTRPVLVLLRPSVKTAAHSLLATASGQVRIEGPRSASPKQRARTAIICPAFVLLRPSFKTDAHSLLATATGPVRIVVSRSASPKQRVRTAVTCPVLVLLRPSVKTAAHSLLAGAIGPARILLSRSASPKRRARTAVTHPVLVLLRPSAKTAAHSRLAPASGQVRIEGPRSASPKERVRTAVIWPVFVLLVSGEQAVSPKLDAKTAAVRALPAGARGPARIVVPPSGSQKQRVRTAANRPWSTVLLRSGEEAVCAKLDAKTRGGRSLLATACGPVRIAAPRSGSPKQRVRTAAARPLFTGITNRTRIVVLRSHNAAASSEFGGGQSRPALTPRPWTRNQAHPGPRAITTAPRPQERP